MVDSPENKLLLFTEFTGSAQRHPHGVYILSSYRFFFLDVMKETGRKKNTEKKKKKPEQLEHKQRSPPSSEGFLRLVSHRRKLRNFQDFSGKTGKNFQAGAF